MFDQVKPKQTKPIFELDSKVLGWFDHGQTKPKFFFGSSLIRSNQTQGPIFGFDLKMLGRFDHRPFEPKSNPFLGSIQRCWAGLTMIKAKSNQAQIRFFAYRSVRSYQTKPNRTHFGFGLTFLMFGLTSVKPNLIKLTLSSILLNNPLFFFVFL
jgi:hypothetical protein